MSAQTMMQPQTRNQVFLLLIVILFVAPLGLAWVLVGHWQPAATSNHGELLNPARPVPHFRMQRPDGRLLPTAYLQDRWTLAYIGAACEKRCRQSLYYMRQVRLALGKDMGRVQTLFMQTQAADAALQKWLHQEHALMTTGLVDDQTLDFFTQVFPGETILGEWIYLIDPLGNLLMRYPSEVDPKGILEDLEHLLKYSKIG
jgi:hypothetical protein